MYPAWLVEIRLKGWEPPLHDGTRVVTYEEVVANNDVSARLIGFKQFEARSKYEPCLRRKLERLGITCHNCCAPDAVELDY